MANFSKSFYPNETYVSKTFVANGEMIDTSIFTVPEGQMWVLLAASENHTTEGSDPGDVTIMLTRQQGTEAAASGDELMTTGFNAKGTAQTVQNASVVPTVATRTLHSGDRLGVNFVGTLTALAGVNITAYLYRIG